MGKIEPAISRKTDPKKKTTTAKKKPKTNPKGLNPSRTYKTTAKKPKKKTTNPRKVMPGDHVTKTKKQSPKKRTGTNPSTKSAAAKKGWATRRKNAKK